MSTPNADYASPNADTGGQFTWHYAAARYPEFVQWIVATYGPLPDGPIREEDYERFYRAHDLAHNDRSGAES